MSNPLTYAELRALTAGTEIIRDAYGPSTPARRLTKCETEHWRAADGGFFDTASLAVACRDGAIRLADPIAAAPAAPSSEPRLAALMEGFTRGWNTAAGLRVGDVFLGAMPSASAVYPDFRALEHRGFLIGYLECVEARWPRGVSIDRTDRIREKR